MEPIRVQAYLKAFRPVIQDLFRPVPALSIPVFQPVSSVSVIIPTCNESKRLLLAVQGIRRERHIAEIIVADGGSTDGTTDLAKALDATVIETERGRGFQIRSATRHSRGDIILVLHADCRIRQGIVHEILSRMNEERTLIGGALGMRFEQKGFKNRLLARLNNARARYLGIAFGDQCQFFRREALPLIGGFPDQMLMEDVELSLRLKRKGRICLIPEGVVVSNRRWQEKGFYPNIKIIVSLMTRYLFERHLGPVNDNWASYYNHYYGESPVSARPGSSAWQSKTMVEKKSPPFLRDRLIVFGRYPIPGRTKTRLIPVLNPLGAADLQRWLTEKTLETAKGLHSTDRVDLEVCFEGGGRESMRQWLGSNLTYTSQEGDDLGRRMHLAMVKAFKGGCRRVVLIGTDIPGLTSSHLKTAFDALKGHDLVLGPSTDGGYWLVGLKQPVDIYQNMPWGRKGVLKQTLERAKDLGLTCHLLDPLRDIDTWEDLLRECPGRAEKRPYISVIIPALNEELHIGETIIAAKDPEAQILVVDGGSTDLTGALAHKAGAHVLSSPPGRARQQNMGATGAKGKVLLFLHADTRLPPHYIKQIFLTLLDRRVALGAFRFKTDLDTPSMKGIEWVTNVRSRFLRLPYGDQALFLRKSLFEAIGGFPEVPLAEDLFFVRGVSRHGSVKLAPSSVTTSGRRWKSIGPIRTTVVNQMIIAGILLGVSPHTLASIYRSERPAGFGKQPMRRSERKEE